MNTFDVDLSNNPLKTQNVFSMGGSNNNAFTNLSHNSVIIQQSKKRKFL